MLKTNTSSIQDNFLQLIMKDKKKVRIFLVNGIKLEGTITAFDQYSVILNNESMADYNSILVYKHAISTVAPFKTESVE